MPGAVDAALSLGISLERIENHLFGMLEDVLVVADDHQRADVTTLAPVLADLQGEGQHPVKDRALDVFVDARLLGRVE